MRCCVNSGNQLFLPYCLGIARLSNRFSRVENCMSDDIMYLQSKFFKISASLSVDISVVCDVVIVL